MIIKNTEVNIMAVIHCPACGKIMSDNLDQCPHCGSADDSQTIIVKTESSYVEDIKKIWNKRNIILMSVGAIVVIAAIFVVVLFNNKTSKFYKNVEANNIEAAKSIYDKEIRGNEKQENAVKTELIQKIDKYKIDYIDKQVSYRDGKIGIDNLYQLGIVNSECADALGYMRNLNDSRTAYEDATRYAESSDYYSAIKAYKKVIEVDSNYQEAKNQILNLTESYKAQILEQVEQNISSQNYDSALNLLETALKVISDESLHAKMAECLVKSQELEKEKARAENKKRQGIIN